MKRCLLVNRQGCYATMADSMEIMREMTKLNRKLDGMSTLITNPLDLQQKMLSCESSVNSPQLNSDFVTGNVNDHESRSILLDLEISRQCFGIGAIDAGWSYIHDANEKMNISRSKYGFTARIMRSTFTQTQASVREERASGFKIGRGKGEM